MNPTRVTVAAAVATFALQAGCLARGVRGSGHVARESREVPPFDGLQIGSGIHAQVEVGAQGPVELEGDDNLLELIETEVRDGVLEVRFERGASVWSRGEVRVFVRAAGLRSLGASGGAEIDVAPLPSTESLELHASGGSHLRVRGLDVQALEMSASGGADLTLAGRAGEVRMHLSGGAEVHAARLSARAVHVQGSGGSRAAIEAEDALRGSLSGGSRVRLLGPARSRVSTSGGSEVTYED